MSELYFLRHGTRIDHDQSDGAYPLVKDYQVYDPSLSNQALIEFEQLAQEIIATSANLENMKIIHVHFSPYLRCIQSADLLITNLKKFIKLKFPNLKIRFQLLADFALSEWIHDKMINKPPFYDSNDAYELYTPNLKYIENKSCLSNFRPTVSLGGWNGYDLSYKDYQLRSKQYFKKLLATYEKKSAEMIIVISHGYMINNFLSFFINNSNFNEVPVAKLNYAGKIYDEWKLFHDCLGLIDSDPNLDTTLNLDSDIVYYKTNFIKKDELESVESSSGIDLDDNDSNKNSRQGFKMSISQPDLTKTFPFSSWTPQAANKFAIKSEFKLKTMNDQAFKKSFDLLNHPSHPVTPEISPNSEPTRNNSIIDLAKLSSNDEIYKPRKLKYTNTGDIPIDKLNSKINSQLNLLQMNNNSSKNSLDSLISSIPRTSQVNLSASLRSFSNSRLNINEPDDASYHFQLANKKEPIMMSLKFNNSNNTSNDSSDESSVNSKKFKLISTIANNKEIKKKHQVFNFLDSESDDDGHDDKRYMWFGGNK